MEQTALCQLGGLLSLKFGSIWSCHKFMLLEFIEPGCLWPICHLFHCAFSEAKLSIVVWFLWIFLQKLQNVFQSKSLVFFVHLVKVTTLNVKSTLMKAVFQQAGTFHSSSVFIIIIVVIFVSSLVFFFYMSLYKDDDSCRRFMDFIVAWLTRNNSEPAKCQRLVISYDILNWNCVTNWSANN